MLIYSDANLLEFGRNTVNVNDNGRWRTRPEKRVKATSWRLRMQILK